MALGFSRMKGKAIITTINESLGIYHFTGLWGSAGIDSPPPPVVLACRLTHLFSNNIWVSYTRTAFHNASLLSLQRDKWKVYTVFLWPCMPPQNGHNILVNYACSTSILKRLQRAPWVFKILNIKLPKQQLFLLLLHLLGIYDQVWSRVNVSLHLLKKFCCLWKKELCLTKFQADVFLCRDASV